MGLQEVKYEGDIQVRMDPSLDVDQGEGHTAHGEETIFTLRKSEM